MRLMWALPMILVLALPSAWGRNLIPNSSFEEGETGWTLWHGAPDVSSGGVEEGQAFVGERCFHVLNPGEKGANLFSDPVPVRAESTYTLSVYCRVTGGTRIRVAAWGVDDAGETIGYGIAGEQVVPDEAPYWGRFAKTFYAPANCVAVKAHLICNGGEVRWDAVQLEAVREARAYREGPRLTPGTQPKNMLGNSSFEEGEIGWTLWHQFPQRSSGRVQQLAAPGHGNAWQVENPGGGGANLFSESVPCEPNTVYTLSAHALVTSGERVGIGGWGLDKDEKVLEYAIDGETELPADVPEWTRFAKTFTTPDGCVNLRAHLVCHGGLVWWDRVQLEQGDAATEYEDGPTLRAIPEPDAEPARQYARGIVREARVRDLLSQARRLVAYTDATAGAEPLTRAEQLVEQIGAAIHRPYLVPGYREIDYDRLNEVTGQAETELVRVWELCGLAEKPSTEWWRPAMAPGIDKEQLAQELVIFPCFTRQHLWETRLDWELLEPFGFRIVSGWYGPGVAPDGTPDFGYPDKIVQQAADHGYLVDMPAAAEPVVRSLFRELGEDVYLHAADGSWSEQGNCHNTVNIWHPAVRESGARLLETMGRHYADNPHVISYELTNELALSIEKRVQGYQYERLGVGGYSAPARAAFRDWLKRRHGDIAALNRAWRTDYADFDAIDPPADLAPPAPTTSAEPIPCGPIHDFQVFRAESHADYFREMVAALRRGDPRRAIMPQFHSAFLHRKDAAMDLLLMGSVPQWDFLGTHDWPGDGPAFLCLYAYSMGRYAPAPHWEDEFIWSQWERKGTPEPAMRAAVERNLWRQIAWGKRGISLFNLESEWLHDHPANWNNSMLNVEAELRVPRYCVGVIPTVERKGNLIKDVLFNTRIAGQGLALLRPTASILVGAPDGAAIRGAQRIAAELLRDHWMPLIVPEECILDGREELGAYGVLIAVQPTHVPDQLQEALLRWVEQGGTLISIGPFGLFNEHGRPTARLLREAYGEQAWRFDAEGKAWLPERELAPAATHGQGRVVLVTGAPDPEAALAAIRAELRRVWPVPPVQTELDRVELILREDGDKAKCLFAVNLNAREPQEGTVTLRGRFADVRELTVEGGPVVPTTATDEATTLPLRLGPGEGLFFALGVDRQQP